jgi:hypothetical protein
VGKGAQAVEEPIDDAIDGAEGDLLFAREMQVDRALADARLTGQVVHRGFLVAISRQQALGGIEDRVADLWRGQIGGHCYCDL